MSFVANGPRVFPVPADWSGAVTETLSWATDYMQSPVTGISHHCSYRSDPRRSFEFAVKCEGQQRRVVDMLLAGHGGRWLVPVWPDVQLIPADLPVGSGEIACRTNGFDFVAGGKALLWAGVNRWEVVTVSSVKAEGLSLAADTVGAWPAGAMLYPLRMAQLQDSAEESLWHDNAGVRSLTFDVIDVCQWPSLVDLPLYLGMPVLNRWADWTDYPKASYARLREVLDNGSATALTVNLADFAFRSQTTQWKLFGREEHSWLRSLAYTLCGRSTPIWLPSYTSDLRITGDLAVGATEIPIEWAGYALFGAQAPGRRDLRIELLDGTAIHRRIVASVASNDVEVITLDAPLDINIVASRVRAVQIMSLATLASDQVEIQHATDADGVASCTLGFASVVPHV
ncbi:hypothetical protein U2S91_08345 [Stenotrophomonas maltophilia]|nr:hypothetical protein [Stenotrophomonas maltophilia]WQI22633.1 hypothetical protein U2S91_08345 [Stenotrophomonas maltophilia]